jgi:peptidoglycan/xylan/chitin deacetylase (PgdA/CDA1 family)
MNRRTALGMLALGSLAAITGMPSARAARVPAPFGPLIRLPGDDNSFALTVDDGTNSSVVAAITDFCQASGTRLTFFVNGVNRSWSDNAAALRPMVDSGQIQLGNHTWSHPDITRLGRAVVADQITRNADFLRNTYGVDGTPYFRPPYGRHNADTDAIATDLGSHTITMWRGTQRDRRAARRTRSVDPGHRHGVARMVLVEEVGERGRRVEGSAVDGGDHVAGCQSSLLSGSAAQYLAHRDA